MDGGTLVALPNDFDEFSLLVPQSGLRNVLISQHLPFLLKMFYYSCNTSDETDNHVFINNILCKYRNDLLQHSSVFCISLIIIIIISTEQIVCCLAN